MINKIKSTNLDKLRFGSGLCGSIFALSVGCMTYLPPLSLQHLKGLTGEGRGGGGRKTAVDNPLPFAFSPKLFP